MGSYDCTDRIMLNGYYPLGHTPGGFHVWDEGISGSKDSRPALDRLMMFTVPLGTLLSFRFR